METSSHAVRGGGHCALAGAPCKLYFCPQPYLGAVPGFSLQPGWRRGLGEGGGGKEVEQSARWLPTHSQLCEISSTCTPGPAPQGGGPPALLTRRPGPLLPFYLSSGGPFKAPSLNLSVSRAFTCLCSTELAPRAPQESVSQLSRTLTTLPPATVSWPSSSLLSCLSY